MLCSRCDTTRGKEGNTPLCRRVSGWGFGKYHAYIVWESCIMMMRGVARARIRVHTFARGERMENENNDNGTILSVESEDQRSSHTTD